MKQKMRRLGVMRHQVPNLAAVTANMPNLNGHQPPPRSLPIVKMRLRMRIWRARVKRRAARKVAATAVMRMMMTTMMTGKTPLLLLMPRSVRLFITKFAMPGDLEAHPMWV